MKIAIVGAGAAGATAAMLLLDDSLHKHHEVVLLDRDEFPRHKPCAGILSPRALRLCRELGLYDALSKQAQAMDSLRCVFADGKEAVLAGKEQNPWILPRHIFDAELARRAEKNGAQFIQGFLATRALRDSAGRICGVSDGKLEIEADLVLFCDGGNSQFSVDRRPRQQIAALLACYEGVSHIPGRLEAFLDPRLRPWCAWLIPQTAAQVLIGILYRPDISDNPQELFSQVMQRHLGWNQRLCAATQIGSFHSATISYTRTVGPVAAPGALWAGEAARLVNAATGEGIYAAMKSARLAAHVIARHKQPGPALYADYTEATARAFGFSLHRAAAVMNLCGASFWKQLPAVLTSRPWREPLHWLYSNV